MNQRSSHLHYLRQYTSKQTVKNYVSTLRSFFTALYGKCDDLDICANRYFAESRDVEADVQQFFIACKGKAPTTIQLRLSGVRTFLLENHVELPQLFWRRLRRRIKGSRPITMDKVPTNAELRQIMTHLPLNGKALFLLLSSSGMRIGAALQLTLDDVDFTIIPTIIHIRGDTTKSGNSRVTFISAEATEILREWLKIRDSYLHAAVNKSIHRKSRRDDRLFPFSVANARSIWNNALRKTGNSGRDKRTNWYVMHPHVLRKFFRTNLDKVIPADIVEALLGHETYLISVYRKYDSSDLANFYHDGEHALAVFSSATEQLTTITTQLKDDNTNLQRIVNGLHAENLTLKAQLRTNTEKLAKIEQIIIAFQKTIS
jgi:integrase